MAITKEQLLAEIAKRKAAKAALEAKTTKKRVTEAKAAPTKIVVEKAEMNNLSKEPKTIQEALNRHMRKVTDAQQKAMYSVLTENIVKATQTMYGNGTGVSVISEATQAGPYIGTTVSGNAAGVGLVKTYFDIFFGYFPNLIAHEIASVQPIKTEKAMVFFYQSVAGSSKGAVTEGQVLIDPFQINTNTEYTSDEVTINTGSTAVPVWGPVIPQSVKIPGQELTWSNDTTATFTVDSTSYTVAVTEASGTIKVEVETTVGSTDSSALFPKATYAYANKYAPTAVPELNANVDSREITAKPRTIKTKYSFQAGFGFEAQFGKSLEDQLAEAAMYELKREIDLDLVFEVMKNAPTLVQWNRAAGVANGLYEFHKLSFLDAVIAASNKIFKDSKRVRGNILLVGPNAQTIVETLPAFQGENYGSQLGGATVIGKLKDIKVIAIPDLEDNDWAVIYKDQKDSLNAGLIFAPYIPVVSTPTVMLDDFMARKAFTTSYGKLIVNNKYFVRGTIINNPIAQPIQVLNKDGEIIEAFGDTTSEEATG
jgi:hypothetical protein